MTGTNVDKLGLPLISGGTMWGALWGL